jgi:hypothetical protein
MPDEAMAMPERIGRYELLIPIGTGGMGSVYLARHEVMPGVERDVAIKLMHPQLRANDGIAEQLLSEAKLSASIRHANVVSVLEAGQSPHGVYLALDYIEGDTLSGLLRASLRRGEPLPFRIAARILHDALTGLHAAHELTDERGKLLDVVHRDFSPQNILIGVDGMSRLTDFGIAKALGQLNATATGIVKGKVGYMAPEQARGESLDRRCDVWAAGVVAWEAIAGKRLFRGPNEAATLLQVISDKPPPPVSSERSGIACALDEAVAAALEPKPARRVATALAFRARLEDAWTRQIGIADHEEVAAFVNELVGAKLRKRAAQAADVLRLRRQIDGVKTEADVIVEEDATSGLSDAAGATEVDTPVARPMDESGDGSTKAALSAATAPAPQRRSWMWLLATAAVLVGSGVAFATLWKGTTATAPPTPTETVAATTPSAPPSNTLAQRVLRITADRPIAQLRIGERNIALAEPVANIEVPVSDAGIVDLRAIAKDGTAVDVVLQPGQSELTLTFPNAPLPHSVPPRRARPPVGTSPAPTPKDEGPGLADSPY